MLHVLYSASTFIKYNFYLIKYKLTLRFFNDFTNTYFKVNYFY
jgi:hypothetical protein